MNDKKIDFNLTGVSQTLLLPLLARAKFSQFPNPPLYDAQAIKLIEKIDYDFNQLFASVGYATSIWMIARAYQFDAAIKVYLQRHPKAVIVNLGAGLDTTFYRVDNGQLTWLDIDLPQVIDLRKTLLPVPDKRVHYLAYSLLDSNWIDAVKKFGEHIFFVAGGLFMYFPKAQAQSLLVTMANKFPQAELIFDAIPSASLAYVNAILEAANIVNAKLQWGLDYGYELERWSGNIKLISQLPYFNSLSFRHHFPFVTRLRMLLFNLYKRGGIIHVKFLA